MPSPPRDRVWLDDAAGRLVRPYAVSDGRTRPSAELDLLSMVLATGRSTHVHPGPEHLQVLRLCRDPVTVAEVAAHVRLPATVTKILLSDLVACGAVTSSPPAGPRHDPSDRELLEAVLHGLRTRL